MFEKRLHQRLPLVLQVILKFKNGKILQCQTKNISFGGMRVDPAHDLAFNPGEQIDCILKLPEERRGVVIDFECTECYANATGIGLQFQTMDLINYNHFKWLMVANHPEPARLMDELYENPGIMERELVVNSLCL